MVKMTNKLWERQPWDSDLEYTVFQRWLLQEFRPRDLDQAWRDHVGKDRTDTGRKIGAPSYIITAFAGNSSAQIELGSDYTWEQRAREWDIEQQKSDLQAWDYRRHHLRLREWNVAMQLLNKAKEMLEWPLYIEEEIHDEDGTTIIRTPTKWNVRDASSMVKTASELARLSAEMAQGHFRVDFYITLSPAAIDAMDRLMEHGVPRTELISEFEQIIMDAAKQYDSVDTSSNP